MLFYESGKDEALGRCERGSCFTSGTLALGGRFLRRPRAPVKVREYMSMKTLVSTLAFALALAFTGPAFAGDVTKATDKASCDKAGGAWDDTAKKCIEKM
jgi:hypothetical protein